MTTVIRSARKSDHDVLVSISTRTIRASYIPFLGKDAVEGWLEGGTVDGYFTEKLADCRIMEANGEIVGFCVALGGFIDLMMIDSERHREGFGQALLSHVESEAFRSHDELSLESFRDNQRANAFYAAQGWSEGAPFDDADTGIAMIVLTKQRPLESAR
jgi:ribosomal protein S18 acetylase RimI-like enzyme